MPNLIKVIYIYIERKQTGNLLIDNTIYPRLTPTLTKINLFSYLLYSTYIEKRIANPQSKKKAN